MLPSAYTILDVVGEKAVEDMVGDANSCGAIFKGDGTDVCCGGNKTNKRVDKCHDVKKNCDQHWAQVNDEDPAVAAPAGACYVCEHSNTTDHCIANFVTASGCKLCEVCYDQTCYDATLPCASGWDTCPKNDKGEKRKKDSCDKLSECTWGVPCYYKRPADCPDSMEAAGDVHVN